MCYCMDKFFFKEIHTPMESIQHFVLSKQENV